jgi:4-hydroxy-tetrahydrodipicolinate synthase
MPTELKGVFPVLLTPFDSDDSVDVATLRSYLDYLLARGVHGLAALGSTSEAQQLNRTEWQCVLETVLEHVGGRAPVVVGVSANATREVIERARAAQETGASGVMVTHPFYCLPQPHELVNHYMVVAEAIDLPIMVYNNPVTTGVDLIPEALAELSLHPNITYVKESSGIINRVSQIVDLSEGRMQVFCGWDDLALESFLQGAEGWVSAGANVLPEATRELYRLAEEQAYEAAELLWRPIRPFMTYLDGECKYVQLTKAGIKLRGLDCGIPRLPLLPAPDVEVDHLRTLFERAESAFALAPA